MQKLLVIHTSRSEQILFCPGCSPMENSIPPNFKSASRMRLRWYCAHSYHSAYEGPRTKTSCTIAAYFYAMLSYESSLNHCSQHSNEPLRHNNIMNTAVLAHMFCYSELMVCVLQGNITLHFAAKYPCVRRSYLACPSSTLHSFFCMMYGLAMWVEKG